MGFQPKLANTPSAVSRTISFSSSRRGTTDSIALVSPSRARDSTAFRRTNQSSSDNASHPELFFIGHYISNQNLSKYRWTVDEPEDFVLIEKIYQSLYPLNKAFKMEDILRLMNKNPEMKLINQKIERNEGMKKSLIEDQEWLS